MIFIDVRGEIVNDGYASMMKRWFGEDDSIFSLSNVKDAIESNPEDNDVVFNLNSFGGDIQEALDIYDYCRGLTGKTFYANIIGDSSSAASVILLTAAKKNRSGNAHCYATLHFTSGGVYGKLEDVEKQAELMRKYNDALVDIYVDRTGMSRSRISAMMEKDEKHMATDLLAMGFISSINAYTTAQGYAFGLQESIFNGKIAAMAKTIQLPKTEDAKQTESDINTLIKIFQ